MSSLPAFDRRAGATAGIDLVVVLVFALIGRRTHESPLDLGGILHTTWPFVIGLLVGWAVVARLGRTWPTRIGHGVSVWACTVVVGMLLRMLSGQGTAPAFVIVATLFLGVTLIGGRFALQALDQKQSAGS